jgi:hypothetical protein
MTNHTKVVTLKMTTEEFSLLKEAAVNSNLTVSEFVRELIAKDGKTYPEETISPFERRVIWLLVHIFSINKTTADRSLSEEALDNITEYANDLMKKWRYK